MKKREIYRSFLVLSLLLQAGRLPAQEVGGSYLDIGLEALQNIVVTDTKVGQPQETVTQRVEVIDAEDMARQTALNRNISEFLVYRSGLFVNPLSRNDANWGSFGGLGPKYNGYLLNGLPMDSFVDAMSLDPWAIDRVELYMGPASVMYSNYLTMDFAGNEAPLTGITNFILKDAVDSRLTRVRLGGGSYGTLGGKVYHQDRKDDLSYFFGANYEKSDYTDYGSPGSWLNILQDPDYQKAKFYAKASYLLGRDDHKLSLFYNHTSHTGNAGRPHRDFNHDYDTVNLEYSDQISPELNLQFKGGYRGYDRRWGEDNSPANLDLKDHSGVEQEIIPGDLSLNLKHHGESLLTFGADGQAVTYRTYTEIAGGSRATDIKAAAYSGGLFLQEKLILGKWVLRAGGRLNYTRHHYDTVNGAPPVEAKNMYCHRPLWSLGARYNMSPEAAIYGNAGTSFVAPSAKQIYGTVLSPNGQLPNTGIKTESGLGSDIGLDWRPSAALSAGLRAFYNRLTDAIIDNIVSVTPSVTQSVNSGKANSYGFELDVVHKFSGDLLWFANLTYTVSKVENPLDPDNDGTRIPFVPVVMANAGATLKLPAELEISPYLHMVGNYYDSTSRSGRSGFGQYQVLNVKMRKGLLSKNGYDLDAALDLNNIGNKKFYMPFGFRDTGFNVFAGLEMAFF